jgi:hypothetical protein
MKRILCFLPSVIVSTGLISCEKNKSIDSSLSVAEGEVLGITVAEASAEEDHSVSMEAPGTFKMFGIMEPGMGPGRHHLSECAEITESGMEFPREIIIDFGEGCEDWRGNTKTGKIIVWISDTMINEGATRTVSYENYSVRGNQVNGSKTVVNKGKNEEGNWVIESQSNITIIRAEDGMVINRVSYALIEWLTGFETAEKSDDSYLISGSGSISQDETVTFSRQVLVPMLIDRDCRYILSGQVQLTNEEGTIILDYGNGTCDNTATVTRDGEIEEIDLTLCKFRGRSKFKIGRH